MKDSFYKELECVFDKFPKYRIKTFLEDFNARVCRDDIFKPIIGIESLYEISNDNGVKSRSLDSIVGIANGYGLDDRGVGD
jgi:hypothetical protein